MRQIGTLIREDLAQRFADYLLTKEIIAQAEEDSDGWAIWVREENLVEAAREELQQFRLDPDAAVYRGAAQKAEDVRRQQAKRHREVAKNVVEMRGRWQRPSYRKAPLVFALIGVSALVSFLAGFQDSLQPVHAHLTFCRITFDSKGNLLVPVDAAGNVDGFRDIFRGEVWRLVTPIFVHFGILHIVFNMYWLYFFGTQIEERRGTWRLALLIVAVAIGSNVGAYLGTHHVVSGGMSGVVYGLFGYVWMKTRFDPGAGLYVTQSTVVILVAWFFLCAFGFMDTETVKIGNWAHGIGLGMGIAIGYAPVLFRRLGIK